eukprot:3683734-Rhodomonas_salina.1
MGWTRIAILHVNDAWGRGFARDAVSSASDIALRVVLSIEFRLGDSSSMEQAIRELAESGARITLCIAFKSDIAAIAAIADEYGMLKTGYAWIAPEGTLTLEAVALSPNPESTRKHLSGWFTAAIDPFDGEQGQVFQSVLESEPLLHLNHSYAGSEVAASIASASCDQFCSLAYDAVWAAAIAMSKMEL